MATVDFPQPDSPTSPRISDGDRREAHPIDGAHATGARFGSRW